MKEFDPNWPFPQYDEDGKRLLPPPAPRQKKQTWPDDLKEALL